MALHPQNRTERPERTAQLRVPMEVQRYITPNLIAQIAAHEGFYSKVSGDTQGSQVGLGYNRGSNTLASASNVLGRPITKKSKISYEEAVALTTHKIGEKIKQFVEPHIGQDRFDKLSANRQAAVLDTLYNLTDKAGTNFAKKIAEKIDLDQTAGIPALIASYGTMKGTIYEAGLKKRRGDAFNLAMLPDGLSFTPSKAVYDFNTKLNVSVDTFTSHLKAQHTAEPRDKTAKEAPAKNVVADNSAKSQPQNDAAPTLISRILTVLRPLYTNH